MNQRLAILSTAVLVTTAFACAPSPAKLQEMMEKNPEIVFGAIEKNPDKFLMVMSKVEQEGQAKMRENQEKEEAARFERELANPLAVEITADRAAKGEASAPVTIVEYTDFQCPFCARGNNTMKQVMEAYPGKVRLVYKSLPLPMHPLAKPAAARFEAIAMQDVAKAWKFHDELFDTQDKLNSDGEKHLDALAKKVGANVAKMKADMKSERVENLIKADMDEAQKHGISGTPGFIVAGVAVRGAYPFETFKNIIDKKLAAK